MQETINILCATDKNFVPYCGIMLTSLFENNKENKLRVFIIVDESVTLKVRTQFTSLGKEYGQQVEIVPVDASMFEQYPVYNKQWTNSIYYRLLATELLSKSIDKIIYLDCDIIVTDSIIPYWEININNYAVGCVPDIWAYKPEVYERLSLYNDGQYFNSGSMLINLKYWREHNLKDAYLKYIADNFEKLWFNDQDTLNGVLFNQKLIIPVKYNYQIVYLQKNILSKVNDMLRKEVLETERPLIIHYAATVKPWMILYYKMPYYLEWLHYKKMSYWSDTKNSLPKTKLINWLIKRYILWPLKIMKNTEYILR